MVFIASIVKPPDDPSEVFPCPLLRNENFIGKKKLSFDWVERHPRFARQTVLTLLADVFLLLIRKGINKLYSKERAKQQADAPIVSRCNSYYFRHSAQCSCLTVACIN